MASVTLDERGLLINGSYRPLAAGQFEYWRHHRLYWRRILDLMRGSGLEFVATFVCWDFHEVAPGEFDFTGQTYPSRDLAGFIEECAAAGLQVLLRVGPNIDAEWPSRGPAPDVTPLERLHPRYLERTREYLEALAPIMVPRLATRGGPVVLVSIDNEPYFPYSTNVESDPSAGSNAVPYDRDLITSLYREWLTDRYGSSAALADAWSRNDARLECATEPEYASSGLVETLDSFSFITAMLRRAFELQVEMCRELGVDVPIYSNMKQFTHYVDWREIEQVVDSHGVNVHMPNGWPGDQKLVASWYCRVARATTRFPWAPEFQGATSIGLDDIFGILGSEQGKWTSLMAMAMGLRGLSYYMFVERDDSHYAPISPIGKVRPQLAGFSDAIRALKEVRPDTHLTSVGLLWSIDHHRSLVASLFPDWRNLYDIWIHMDQPKEHGPWWELFRQLHAADVDFDVVPFEADLDRYRILLYAGPDFAQPEQLQRLRRWVERGGTLVRTTALPVAADAEAPSVYLPTGHVAERLAGLGAEAAIRALHPDLWSSAYEDREGWSLFVTNVGDEPTQGRVCVGRDLAGWLVGRSGVDVLTGQRWTVRSEHLWEQAPTLVPNETRLVRVLRGGES